MCIGEVAHVSAEITYTSKHSVEVQVNVMSENILTGNNFQVLLACTPRADSSSTSSLNDLPNPHAGYSVTAFCRWGIDRLGDTQ
jgi:hypothetical protein